MQDTIKAWFSALSYALRQALQVNISRATAGVAVRSTFGLILPLFLGIVTRHTAIGVSLAGGAISVGSVGLANAYHTRRRMMLLSCVAIALSAFVGSTSTHIVVLAIVLAGVWGFGAGLLSAFGMPALIVGLQAGVAFIILSHFALDPVSAIEQAALMFVGALFQTVLAFIIVPAQTITLERKVLSGVYTVLATYAGEPIETRQGSQVRDALANAQNVLMESNAHSPRAHVLFNLLEIAEHLRLNILVFRRARHYLVQHKDTQEGTIQALDELLLAVAAQTQEIAEELRQQPRIVKGVARRLRPHQRIKQSLKNLRAEASITPSEQVLLPLVAYGDTLRDYLHSARKLAKSLRQQEHYPRIRLHLRFTLLSRQRWRDFWMTLRAQMTLRSAPLRHALRLGCGLALATALYRLGLLPVENGYWIPLTVLLVLRPDFTTTFTRGFARLLGTFLGALLATVLINLLAPGQLVLVALEAITAYLALSLLLANYAFFSLFLTIETVILLSFVMENPITTGEFRAIDTLIGGLLALLLYVLWPTWERSRVMDYIAMRIERVQRYCVAVLHVYANPNSYDHDRIDSMRRESRLARVNAEGSVERALHEPVDYRTNIDLAQSLLDAADTIVARTLVLEGYVENNPREYALGKVAPCIENIDEAFHCIVLRLRQEKDCATSPDLQAAEQAIKAMQKSFSTKEQDAASIDRMIPLDEMQRILQLLDAMHQSVIVE